MSDGGPRRAPILVLVAAALVAGGLADRLAGPRAEPATEVSAGPGMPVAAPRRALSTTWYCAAATARPDAPADGTIVVANAGPRTVTGRVTVVPDEGEPRTVPLTVGPASRASLRHQDIVQADYAAALVELDGGEVAVEHEVTGRLGYSVAPCASGASDRWYFADGSTAREDAMLLFLFNPFPEDAIVDLTFSTNEGKAAPADFQGVVVRGGHLGVVNVAEHVRRREEVAVTVTARSGRLVVDRLQLRGGARKGINVALGAPSLGREWYFPEGVVSEGVRERFHLYNPSSREASVDVEVALEQGAAEPFQLTIPPGDRLTLLANEEGRLPDGVPHAVKVVALNEVAIVAERSLEAVAPSARQGSAQSLGARRPARRWALAAGESSDTTEEWVVVQNAGPGDATVSVAVLAGGEEVLVEGLEEVVVPHGQRRGFRIGDTLRRQDLALVVSSSAPVVVERTLYRLDAPGISTAIGIPMR